jgi:hypothetical protein
MGTTIRSRRRSELPGVLYWVYRALLCLMIAPLIGALVGLLGVVVGVLLGELAAVAVLVLFMADIYLWMVRARTTRTDVRDRPDDLWDPEFDG